MSAKHEDDTSSSGTKKPSIGWLPPEELAAEAHLLVRLGDEPREAVRAVGDECGMHRGDPWRRAALRHLRALMKGRKGQ